MTENPYEPPESNKAAKNDLAGACCLSFVIVMFVVTALAIAITVYWVPQSRTRTKTMSCFGMELRNVSGGVGSAVWLLN